MSLAVSGCSGASGGAGTPSGDSEPAPGTDAVEESASETPVGDAPLVWQRVEPSAPCLEGMQAAADEPDFEAADTLVIETLSMCSSAVEWLSALEREPGALGLTERAEIGRLDLEVVCWGNEATPVCENAIATGAIEPAD